MEKKWMYLLILILVIMGSTILIKEDDILKDNELPGDTKITDLITRKYSEKELSTIEKLQYNLNEYNEKYPIECLREYNDIYKAIYLGKESYLVVLFDKDGQKQFAKKYAFSVDSKQFNKLSIGMSIESVRELDKNGNYTNLYTGTNKSNFSEHYTEDGYYIYILYDAEYNIIDKKIDII